MDPTLQEEGGSSWKLGGGRGGSNTERTRAGWVRGEIMTTKAPGEQRSHVSLKIGYASFGRGWACWWGLRGPSRSQLVIIMGMLFGPLFLEVPIFNCKRCQAF